MFEKMLSSGQYQATVLNMNSISQILLITESLLIDGGMCEL